MLKIRLNSFSLLVYIALGLYLNPVYATTTSFEEINSQVVLFKNSKQQGLIITSEEHSVVIDPINEDTSKEIKSYLASNNKSGVKDIVYSHSHWDRITGAKAFDDNPNIIAQSNCGIYFSGIRNKKVVDPTVYFDQIYVINTGEEIIRLHYFGPSHGECMLVAELENSKLLFIPDLVSTRGASFPTDPTLPFLRPATLNAFFDSILGLIDSKQIDYFISGNAKDIALGTTDIISKQKIFWELIQDMAITAEEEGLVDLNNFIAIEKMNLEDIKKYENYNDRDLVNILRRYTSFLNMGR
tara:strand:- start:29 stop:922 length:894 start_codon:yes stop_codon:yes gene_type:complete